MKNRRKNGQKNRNFHNEVTTRQENNQGTRTTREQEQPQTQQGRQRVFALLKLTFISHPLGHGPASSLMLAQRCGTSRLSTRPHSDLLVYPLLHDARLSQAVGVKCWRGVRDTRHRDLWRRQKNVHYQGSIFKGQSNGRQTLHKWLLTNNG